MMKQRQIDLGVGFFMLLGFFACLMMIFKVAGVQQGAWGGSYQVTADFVNVGGLKVRAPVTIAGVRIGEVTAIQLIPGQLIARVEMNLNKIPAIPFDDVSARILTEGLLGSNYVSITPGFDDAQSAHPFLAQGDVIAKTQEALVLENLIGQLLFSTKK
jgi:phospholipid/cholesterol/gamma-HCH transport system substrate-binding protein